MRKYIKEIIIFTLLLVVIILAVVTKNESKQIEKEIKDYNIKVLQQHEMLLAEINQPRVQMEEIKETPMPEPKPSATPKPSPNSSRGEINRDKYTPVKAIVTAYAPYDNISGICNDGSPDTTATMTRPRTGVLAANPRLLPYGTKVFIPDYGVGIVEDTGGALLADDVNIRLDLFVWTYAEAMEWGRREMIVYIIHE